MDKLPLVKIGYHYSVLEVVLVDFSELLLLSLFESASLLLSFLSEEVLPDSDLLEPLPPDLP